MNKNQIQMYLMVNNFKTPKHKVAIHYECPQLNSEMIKKQIIR